MLEDMPSCTARTRVWRTSRGQALDSGVMRCWSLGVLGGGWKGWALSMRQRCCCGKTVPAAFGLRGEGGEWREGLEGGGAKVGRARGVWVGLEVDI